MTTTIHVTLLVGSHLLTGSVITSGRRLLDVLNSKVGEYLTVDDVQVYDMGAADGFEASSSLATLPHALVAKGSIQLVIIHGEKDQDREPREEMRVEKRACAAFVTVPGVALRGTVHVPYSPYHPITPEGFMARDADRFFPVTGAEITAACGGLRLQEGSVQVALVRTAAIEVCCLDIPRHGW
jgi:hypothetical protein